MLVRSNNAGSLRRAHRILRHNAKRISVCNRRERRVPKSTELLIESARQDLRPYRAGDCIPKRRANIIRREVQPRDDSEMLMLRRGLNRRLRRIREHAARKTQQDLRADDAGLAAGAGAAAVVDQQAEGDEEERRAEDDEGL